MVVECVEPVLHSPSGNLQDPHQEASPHLSAQREKLKLNDLQLQLVFELC